MTTTGTTTFDLSFTELAEEAWERAGREMRSGYDLRTARRSMNLMTLEWQNRGINMWTIQQGSFVMTPGLNTYPLPVDTIDLLDHVVRTSANIASNQADLNITRISMPTYATIPNKLAPGRPIQVMVQRMSGEIQSTALTVAATVGLTDTAITLNSTVGLSAAGYIVLGTETIYYNYISGNVLSNCFRAQNGTIATTHAISQPVFVSWLPCVTVWPTPDSSTTYSLVYWRMRRVQDTGAGISTQDMNARFLPAAAAGLAYHIAIKVPELFPRVELLKLVYDEQFDLAASEDREKAAIRLVPRRGYIRGGG